MELSKWSRTMTQKLDAVIGFDFGTSCSKVIIHIEQERYAVNFSSLTQRKDYPYFLPTRLFLDNLGNFSLIEGEQSFSDIKINLMSDPSLVINIKQGAITAAELVTAYLALAFQQVREYFFTKHPRYKEYDLQWSVNLGMPASSYENKELYKTLFIALAGAWEVSFEEDINIEFIKKACDEAEERINFGNIKVEKGFYDNKMAANFSVFPEVIAQIVGYAKSSLRIDGLHLLVDVGASTLDMATFNVHHDEYEDDLFPLFVSKVERLGALMLHRNRVLNLQKYRGVDFDKNIKDFSVIPTIYRGHNNEFYNIEEYDKEFLNKCENFILIGITQTKNSRHPYAPEWGESRQNIKTNHVDDSVLDGVIPKYRNLEEKMNAKNTRGGLRVFLCGGGSQLKEYETVIEKVHQKFNRSFTSIDFNLIQLPNLMNIDNFHRMLVAYGLSFDSFDIGGIKLESEIENLTKK